MQLNDNQQEGFDEARSLLSDKEGNPTVKYQAYLKYEHEYKNKVQALNLAYEEAKSSPGKFQAWPIIGKQYSDDVNDGMTKWVVLGYKNQIESAFNLLKSGGFNICDTRKEGTE